MSSSFGIFIAGYRWSGSGAVSDWLAGHNGLCRVKGSETAFGEIRAINYGLRYLVLTAAERISYGERFGRWALCPDPELWEKILGAPLTHSRGKSAFLYTMADLLYYTAARFHITPPVTGYKQLLDTQLGMDFRSDREYLEAVSKLTDSLRNYMYGQKDKSRTGPELDEAVRYQTSRLLSLFYDRLSTNGKVLIFDNAISGLYPELFNLLHFSFFPGQVIIFVRRDPRDQFAELVKYSGSTFSWSVKKFIRQYRSTQEKTGEFIESVSNKLISIDNRSNSMFIRRISFEDFVLNRDNKRTRLKNDLQEFWKYFCMEEIKEWSKGSPDLEVADGMNGLFNPEKSKENIGIWREAGLTRQMRRIEDELGEFIS